METAKGQVPGGMGPPALSDRELPSSRVGLWRDSVCPGVPPCKVVCLVSSAFNQGCSGPSWICGPMRKSPHPDHGFLGCLLPFPFYLDVLELAQESSFYSRQLSAGQQRLAKPGGEAGRRRTSNYRAEVGIPGRGTALTQGGLDRNGCLQILSLGGPPWPCHPHRGRWEDVGSHWGSRVTCHRQAVPSRGAWRPGTHVLG